MAPELETVVWLDEDNESTPLTTIPGVVLTPPVGSHITIDGTRYQVTAAPEVNYLSQPRYTPEGSLRPDTVAAVIMLAVAKSSNGF